MKNKAINALIEMGMPADIKGFHYIVDAMVLFENKEWRDTKTTVLYHQIAKQNDTTASRVERAMRHAFQIVTTQGNLEIVNRYLTLIRPTNGNSLHTFYLRLTQEK